MAKPNSSSTIGNITEMTSRLSLDSENSDKLLLMQCAIDFSICIAAHFHSVGVRNRSVLQDECGASDLPTFLSRALKEHRQR